jgi:Fe-S cluster biogenesis protein NfuA
MTTLTVKTEPTTNANIVKFITSKFLVTYQGYEFKNIDEAQSSPLAQQLFYLPFVKTVYIAQNFIAIEKYNIVTWDEIQEAVAEQIQEYLNSGKPVVIEESTSKKVPVTVYAESTPNPAVLKFVSNKALVDGTFEFKNIDQAKYAPLARALFHFPFVKEVFFYQNYISITKYDLVEWQEITSEIREFIRKYLEEGKPVLEDAVLEQNTSQTQTEQPTKAAPKKTYEGISQDIVNILDEYIKPAVASDGGNIEFQHFDTSTKTVSVLLQGACSGCPASTFTLKNGIETMLQDMLNDSELRVEAING